MSQSVPPTPDERADSSEKSITLTGRDLKDARRLLTSIIAQSEPSVPETVWLQREPDPIRDELLRRARLALQNRRRRASIFRKGMFGEPAWDMLLVLYLSDPRNPESIKSLSERADVTQSTALRWLDVLDGDELVHRSEHPFDKRRVLVRLSGKAREMLEVYFSGTEPTSQ